MISPEVVTLVVAAVLVVAWYLTYTAARLDRLHTRVEGTFAALDAQLVRRAEAVLELANSGVLDPAGALILAGAATESLEGEHLDQGEREAIESDLTRAIRLIVPELVAERSWPVGGSDERGVGSLAGEDDEDEIDEDADDEDADPEVDDDDLDLGIGEAALARLESAGQRVVMARRFHNDAVTDVLRLRDNPFVRLFRLAGRTELPRTVEFDDDPSSGH